MKEAFLKKVAEYIFINYKDNVEKLCIILPNKRGALFLKKYLANQFNKTIWLPKIISAEELIAELSELKIIEELDLICNLYESYKVCYGTDAEPFDSFVKWGQLILADFNEIDRYLADSKQIYTNLKDIKVIENWSLGEETLSEYQQKYLRFMESLGNIYEHYSSFLILNKWAYQGLAYKQAANNIQQNTFAYSFDKLLFCGFNALNAAEIKIISHYVKQQKADLLWDADNYYLKNNLQEAGLFLRKNFKLFPEKELKFIENNFTQEKNIEIISVPKQIGQAQVVKQKIQEYISNNVPLDKIAIVLANEKLLWPVLKQLPKEVEHVNITMEYPIRYTATYSFIDQLISIQLNFIKQTSPKKSIYYKDFTALLLQPLFNKLIQQYSPKTNTNKIINQVNENNLAFITQKHLQFLFDDNFTSIEFLFTPQKNALALNTNIIKVIQTLLQQEELDANSKINSLEQEYLNKLLKLCIRIASVIDKYPNFNDIKVFKQLFNQVVGTASVPFIGEPLQGIQIMGVLETRTLDFENIIFVNVNEGVLPAGKSLNSFLPNDLKRAFELPLYTEKDSIYAYHFYRLLQRAKNVTITYDSVTDTFGKGEMSRFVTQLLLELKHFNPLIKITEHAANTSNSAPKLQNGITIKKNELTLSNILKKALSNEAFQSLSPSALLVLKECSLKFYFRYQAKLRELTEVEENAEANTFGSILHSSLENCYLLLKNKIASVDELTKILENSYNICKQCFENHFNNEAISGKNLLQLEVIAVYVKKQIETDIELVLELAKYKQTLIILDLEKEFESSLSIQINNKNETIFIKGKIDRIDKCGNNIRLIDYKNSVQQNDKFEMNGLEQLFTNQNFNKQFQLCVYAWLLYKNSYAPINTMQPAIIPFKQYSKTPKFITEEKNKILTLSEKLIKEFEIELVLFIQKLFNKEIPFTQANDKSICTYCAYNTICLTQNQTSAN